LPAGSARFCPYVREARLRARTSAAQPHLMSLEGFEVRVGESAERRLPGAGKNGVSAAALGGGYRAVPSYVPAATAADQRSASVFETVNLNDAVFSQ
jgi:hypothetical protein